LNTELTAGAIVALDTAPVSPAGTIVVLECKGGTDKRSDGHRADTIPICNALIAQGWKAYPLFYSDAAHDKIMAKLSKVDGVIPRVNPGTYKGVTNSKLNALQNKLAADFGVKLMSSPDVRVKMGAKDALVKIKDLQCGMPDTYAYYDMASFTSTFPTVMSTGPRVLKQNRGSQGEGIWICELDSYPGGVLPGDTVLKLTEAVDNHVEHLPLDEFMAFCEQYIVGEEGQLIDQRFLPRIVEGELRVNMVFDKPTQIVHKKPMAGGLSATLASGATYTNYEPDDPQFKELMDKFVNQDLALIMPALEMSNEPLPLIWTSDFILGPKDASGKDTYVVGEFNCSCVGISQQLHLAPMLAAAAIQVCSGSNAKTPVNSKCKSLAFMCL
jgi:glutathione synthase/RimK-type ligase-like ATP-grasp enzyme